MRINLITIGDRPPNWVEQGYLEYEKRLPKECALRLIELPLTYRSASGSLTEVVRKEGIRMLKAIPEDHRVVALYGRGENWSTEDLSRHLAGWMKEGSGVSLLIGGPDGLAPDCLTRANQHWSLGRLTFPHPIVRVLIAEQLYRAWSILKNHPYHRG